MTDLDNLAALDNTVCELETRRLRLSACLQGLAQQVYELQQQLSVVSDDLFKHAAATSRLAGKLLHDARASEKPPARSATRPRKGGVD